jgi:hypothetical protein
MGTPARERRSRRLKFTRGAVKGERFDHRKKAALEMNHERRGM